jgi:hypothetical protein
MFVFGPPKGDATQTVIVKYVGETNYPLQESQETER